MQGLFPMLRAIFHDAFARVNRLRNVARVLICIYTYTRYKADYLYIFLWYLAHERVSRTFLRAAHARKAQLREIRGYYK